MNDSDNFWQTTTDMVRAMHGCPRTERVTNTLALEQDPRTGNAPLTPPTAPAQKLSVTSFPAKLVQGSILTGAALGLVIGAGLNANIFTTALTGGVGAGLGSVAVSVNKKDPKEEAKKLLSQVGDRYARIGDMDKLTTVKEILGYLEGR